MDGRRADGDDHDPVMVIFGDTVARDLCSREAARVDLETGWRLAMQGAADHSALEPEVLTIADGLHALAIRPPSYRSVRSFAEAAWCEVRTAPGRSFVRGMLGHLDERSG